jgi:hypothetical protein
MAERNAARNAAIYVRRCSGLTLKEITREFGLTKETVRGITRRSERQARWYAAQRQEVPSIPIPPDFEGLLNMGPHKSPACRSCGKAMTFAIRISMPPQMVYRCEPCKAQAWIPEQKNEPQRGSVAVQQQQQPQNDPTE